MASSTKKREHRIGVISDTHGLLRDSVADAFKGVEMIFHAGDVGSEEVIRSLEALAPVAAVRGNMDGGSLGQTLPVSDMVEIGEALFCMVHSLEWLDIDPVAAGCHAVISGHTHKPLICHENGILYLNPGSAGPQRFDYPICVGLITINGTELTPKIIDIEP